MKKITLIILLIAFCPFLLFAGEITENFEKFPEKGKITMIDLGAKKCIPCKMMAPILKKLDKAYTGKAVILFIDVWKHRKQAGRFNLRAIPTQIFFDKNGNEIYRHVGFMGEDAIKKQLRKMGVKGPNKS